MSHRDRRGALLAVLLTGLLGGCATVIDGKYQRIQFESRPSGAIVTVDGHGLGPTPVTAELRRNRSYKVRLALPGHAAFHFDLKRRVSGWFVMNLLWGGTCFIGMIIDAVAGTMYTLHARERRGRGRMILHEGSDRLYVRVHLHRQGAPPGIAPPPPPPPPPVSAAARRPMCPRNAGPPPLCRLSFTRDRGLGRRGGRCVPANPR